MRRAPFRLRLAYAGPHRHQPRHIGPVVGSEVAVVPEARRPEPQDFGARRIGIARYRLRTGSWLRGSIRAEKPVDVNFPRVAWRRLRRRRNPRTLRGTAQDMAGRSAQDA